jgi:hypothetical protein
MSKAAVIVSIRTVARSAPRQVEEVLGDVEDLVPERRLDVALQLRQVDVGAGAAAAELRGVVEKVEAEVDRLADTGSSASRAWRSTRCQPRGRTIRVGR